MSGPLRRIAFDSGHVRGDYTGGRLTVGIRVEDETAGLTTWDDASFSVPPDFHTHNDAVAAALMTLAGTRYRAAMFNFPISTFCAETLGRFYRGVEIGPVDPSAAPRRAGTRLALNFSGGLDSTLVAVILDEALEGDFSVITSEYGGFFAYEEQGYRRYRRDVSCRTNLRDKRLDRRGRFNFCVPLLYADYAGLGSITTGHVMLHGTYDLDPLIDGSRPPFLHDELVVNAGGLEEVHLVRGIHTPGIFRMLVALAPERAEHALAASMVPGSRKHYLRAWVLRATFEDAELPVPDFLRAILPPRPPIELGANMGADLILLWYVKREGLAAATAVCPKLADFDLSFLDDLSLDFLWRYHQRYVELIPQPLRARVLAVVERCGISCSTSADLAEIAVVRRFLAESGVHPRPAAPGLRGV